MIKKKCPSFTRNIRGWLSFSPPLVVVASNHGDRIFMVLIKQPCNHIFATQTTSTGINRAVMGFVLKGIVDMVVGVVV